MKVNLGMFAMPLHRAGRDYATTLAEDQETVILADKLGFSEYYIGEHHTSGIETVTSPLVFLASVAERTKNIRLGSGTLNLPQMHPVAVASNIAMLDHLTNGRYIFGAGPGTLVTDVEAFGGLAPDVRGRMAMESLDLVQKLLTMEPPFELQGEFWKISLKDSLIPHYRTGWMPRPVQLPHPPIALTMVSPQSSTAKTAGARGWIPISANFVNRRYLKGHWESYAQGSSAAGRVADPSIWRVVRCCLATQTDQQAEDYLADPENALNYYYGFIRHIAIAGRDALYSLKPDVEMSDAETTVPRIVQSQVIAGSPDTVLRQLIALREEIGHFGTLVVTSHDWDRPAMWKRSMELLANEIMPRFNAHIGQTAFAR